MAPGSLLRVSIVCDGRIQRNELAIRNPRLGAAPPHSYKIEKEAKSRPGAAIDLSRIHPGAAEQHGSGRLAAERLAADRLAAERLAYKESTTTPALPRVSSLPHIAAKKAKPEEPSTGNYSLDRVLAKLNKPRLREALECLVSEVTKGKAKNPSLALFKELNVSGDGNLTRDEVSAGLRRMGVSLLPVELEAVMRAFDIDGNGCIDPDEFTEVLKAYQEKFPTPVPERRQAVEPFPVGAHVHALFKLPNMSSSEGTVVAKGVMPGSYEVLFHGADKPAVVKASQIKCR